MLDQFGVCRAAVVGHSTGGAVATADVLVGADGIGSVVRRRYLPHVRVVDTGRCMLMGATRRVRWSAPGYPG